MGKPTSRIRALLIAGGSVTIAAMLALSASGVATGTPGTTLTVELDVAPGLLDAPVDGRVLFLVDARGETPVNNVWVEGTSKIFGENVTGITGGSSLTMSGGGGDVATDGVYGWPHQSLDGLPAGDYTGQAVLVRYETSTRSDGSVVQLMMPCGDGGTPLASPGTLLSDPVDFSVGAGASTVSLTLDSQRPTPPPGQEIGGCEQGNFADTATAKYVKIRSERLSEFWGRDMYVGANVRLPMGYDPDRAEGYPVIYSQGHWPRSSTPFWDYDEETRFILVTVRQESPYYDDAYSVNSANLGPWGDAINDELVREIDARFNTIPAPYGRLQEGGSTGGWSSLASTIFRPDLYGAAWSYYPDSLDFHAHQNVNLYDDANAYARPDGSVVGSWRDDDGEVTVTMPEENHYELALGTNSRSFDQWDVWNAVFSPQGYNGYPLDPWDKVDGTIDHDTADLWAQQHDLTAYLTANWSSERALGEALRGRIHVSVGTMDNFYLEGGVEYFKAAVERLGGTDWAHVHIVDGRSHNGYYNYLEREQQLDEMWQWVQDHAPSGITPLTAASTAPTASGNDMDEVLAWGGRQAAIDRQADPAISPTANALTRGATIEADFGSWDPAMSLRGQWLRDGRPVGDPVDLGRPRLADVATSTSNYTITNADAGHRLAFAVTGSKRGYATETRTTQEVSVAVLPSAPSPLPSASTVATPVSPFGTTASPGGTRSPRDLARTGAEFSPAPPIIGGALVAAGMLVRGLQIGARRRDRASSVRGG